MIVIAAFAGLLSIACRQTNIVWIAFYAALVAIDAAANYLHITNPDRLPIELLTNRNRWSAIGIGIRHIWPFILLAAIFIGAVCWNHGLALGDRTAHQLVYHGMQLCYAYTFMVASAFPAIALNNPIVLITIAISIIPIVIAFNYAHPYLLADNRHFTFYLWRRLLSPYRFAFIPVYVISMAIAAISIDNESKRFRIGLAIATILVTIPNGLLEFRKYTQLYVISIVLGYFIVPYVVWRLHILRNVNRWILIAEMTLNVIINCVVVYLFLYRPFRWTHVDELQRFMW
jgi:alpha-1,2-glucosyltransferase